MPVPHSTARLTVFDDMKASLAPSTLQTDLPIALSDQSDISRIHFPSPFFESGALGLGQEPKPAELPDRAKSPVRLLFQVQRSAYP